MISKICFPRIRGGNSEERMLEEMATFRKERRITS